MSFKTEKALFIFEDQSLEITNPDSVLQTLLDHKVSIDHSCGGFATCGTCRVIVEKDVEKLPPRNEIEESFAAERGFFPEERLACQLRCRKDLVVSRPAYFKTKKGFE